MKMLGCWVPFKISVLISPTAKGTVLAKGDYEGSKPTIMKKEQDPVNGKRWANKQLLPNMPQDATP